MEWISVKDKPLPKDTNFWFLDEHGGQGNAYFKSKEDGFYLETFDCWKIHLADKIIFWMPLPESPVEEN